MLNQRRKKKEIRRAGVRQRIRRRVRGNAERPRLAVFRSERHLHLQVIDDVEGKTLVVAIGDPLGLNYSVTATDSTVFSEPVVLERRWLSVPGEEIRSYECSWEADHL